MKGEQFQMREMLDDIDRMEREREKRETQQMMLRLDSKYVRMGEKELLEQPDGSVIIIGQELFRNGRYNWHFYRTVMTFAENRSRGRYSVFVQADNKEWPEVPPWAHVIGHEDEPRDIDFYRNHIHWCTGQVTEPIKTWWQKKWEEYR